MRLSRPARERRDDFVCGQTPPCGTIPGVDTVVIFPEAPPTWAGVKNLELLHGTATLESTPAGEPHRVYLADETLEAESIYLDLGSRALVPPIEGADSVEYLTEVELLSLEQLPSISAAAISDLSSGRCFTASA